MTFNYTTPHNPYRERKKKMSIEVKILFFAKSREIVGKQVSVVQLPTPIAYENLLEIIVNIFELHQIKSNIILALNEEYCVEGQTLNLKQGDEIAVIPPLSGDDAMEKVAAANCGAVSIFVGTTRDNFENKKVVSLEYEAYEGMAEKTIKKICGEMREKWKSIENIAVYHRLGNVPVKESSVVIAISSPHRKDSLEATQYCIDTLKQTVPIWKKEIYEESESKWKENTECPWTTTIMKNKSNKRKFVFNPKVECSNISSHLVQITCSSDEINRRINTFINRKREQVNQSNIRDFCGLNSVDSCARINSKLIRTKNTKSHLRSQRVFNDLGAYNPVKLQFISDAVSKRIEYIEDNLELPKPVAPDIYERIKKIEDRILFLETLSPEYAHFWKKDSMFLRENTDNPNISTTTKKQKFSLEYVDNLLYELEKQTHTTSV